MNEQGEIARFGRYLLGELRWELEKFGTVVPGLTDAPPEVVEVLDYTGYESLRLRTPAGVFEARLDWSAQTSPSVTLLESND